VRRAAGWAATLVVSLAALVGLIALINSRDPGGVDTRRDAALGPGTPYRGGRVLSPALAAVVKRGNVIVLYRAAQPPRALRALATPGGRALEQAGQAVVLEREPRLKTPLAAVSAKTIEVASSPAQLQGFIDYWLGGG
jgi:hypothetical protein